MAFQISASTGPAIKNLIDRLALIVGGDGAGNYYIPDIDANGNVKVRNLIWNTSSLQWEAATGSLAGGGSVTVNNFPAIQTVSASSLPLPTGAATEATLATNTVSLVPSATAPIHFQANVTTAGVRVQLASNTCKWMFVKAKSTNTGNIFIGGATVTSANGYILTPGEAVSFDANNTNLIYIDSAVNGEGVSVFSRN